MKPLVLSKRAAKQLEKILEHVETFWSIKVRKDVASLINKHFKLIESNPDLFTNSIYNKKLRKCVISKQTTLFYIIQTKQIVVVSVFDTRQNPKKIKKQL